MISIVWNGLKNKRNLNKLALNIKKLLKWGNKQTNKTSFKDKKYKSVCKLY